MERSLAHTPQFHVMFIRQNNERAELSLGENEEQVSGRPSYRAEVWVEGTAERMLEHFRMLLEGAVADPRRPPAGAGVARGYGRHRVAGAPCGAFMAELDRQNSSTR